MNSYIDQLRRLSELGPRASGNEAHRALIEDVASSLADLGYTVHRDGHTFERWEVDDDRYSFSIDGAQVTLSSAWPYSGESDAAGIRAPLAFVNGVRKNWGAAAGKIAVIDVHNLEVPSKLLFDTWSGDLPFASITNPVVGSELAGTDLARAREAGVLGVVATWRGLPDAAARGQYLPFTRAYQGIPAVWVAESERERVLAAARRGDLATLVLDATKSPGASMDTVWTIAPGTGPLSNEAVLVVTHSDGSNAVEENGHIGLLALARDAATTAHNRTIVFIYTAGHLRIPAVTERGQATTAWLEAHHDLWSPDADGLTAVAGLVIEHLGAKHYHIDPDTGQYVTDGTAEPEILYATTPELADLARTKWSGVEIDSCSPLKPGALVHLGEGEPLFQHGIPAIALVTGPLYLLAELRGDLVDVEVLARQVESFRRLQTHLTEAPRDSIGTVKLSTKFEKVAAVARTLGFVLRNR